jgi:cytoplasmic iron level regulating protein YaaA (DUF328/UPF0246 family)
MSPSKKMDTSSYIPLISTSCPTFISEAFKLARLLNELDDISFQKVIDCSNSNLQIERLKYLEFNNKNNCFIAGALYSGEAFTRMDFRSWNGLEVHRAQNSLFILSGLYGVVKPMDEVYPYRLMVGTKWSNDEFSSLYDFWKNKLKNELTTCDSNEIIWLNLASSEYSKLIPKRMDGGLVIDFSFKTLQNGKLKSVSSFSKQCRGEMVKLIIQSNPQNLNDIKALRPLNYSFSESHSNENSWCFVN